VRGGDGTCRPLELILANLPGSCLNLISMLVLNPAHFSQSRATRWSYSGQSKNTSGQWVLEGVCQISNLKSKNEEVLK
jgi:hypothetical protein